MPFLCGRYRFSLERPLIMGIVNVTPDSFSDGGRYFAADSAIAQALSLRAAGADILDIGGESTRPGAVPVSIADELARVLPVIEGLGQCGAALSVDTMKPEVMRAALAAGVDMINDVTSLARAGALQAVADSGCGLCLMHMQGEPQTMQTAPHYENVVAEVASYLRVRLDAVRAAGIAPERIVIDPGFGFGKKQDHNIALFKSLPRFADMAPVLVGVSRKSLIGEITGQSADNRLVGSVAAAMLAVMKGAAIVRVHDVRATVDALKIMHTLGENS